MNYNFDYYIHFFHDGEVIQITQLNGEINLHLSSMVIPSTENHEHILLDSESRLDGHLLLRSVRSISVNSRPWEQPLGKIARSGQILDLDIKNGEVELGVEWCDYQREVPKELAYTMIRIQAKKIIWIDKLNAASLDVTGLDTTRAHE